MGWLSCVIVISISIHFIKAVNSSQLFWFGCDAGPTRYLLKIYVYRIQLTINVSIYLVTHRDGIGVKLERRIKEKGK